MRNTYDKETGFFGDKLYQRRARIVLPILVRQAKSSQPIYYEDLASEIGMPNPRNLNYPLGCIGEILNELNRNFHYEITYIQAIVKNKRNGLPGPGFDDFLEGKGESWSNSEERRAIIETYWARIAAYPYWDDVLEALKLVPAAIDLSPIITKAGGKGGSEGTEHSALKEFVQKTPHVVGLKWDDQAGQIEYPLPSGDSVDVVFVQERRIHAVEVKSASSDILDITRGLFQCVKYRAVLRAQASYEQDSRSITVCLALGGVLPSKLIPLRNSLGIDVFESIVPNSSKST